MSDVVPKFILEAWSVAKDSTTYPQAKMKIEVIPAVAKCKCCGNEATVKSINLECPKCKSQDFKIISGREFLIKEIVAK
jgi:hydrogenase nickel incorporation protein HypA/HybF